MWLKQQFPFVLVYSCLCSSISHIQNGLFSNRSSVLNCCVFTSKVTLLYRSLNVTGTKHYTKALALAFTLPVFKLIQVSQPFVVLVGSWLRYMTSLQKKKMCQGDLLAQFRTLCNCFDRWPYASFHEPPISGSFIFQDCLGGKS
jgi:hypothetical protein